MFKKVFITLTLLVVFGVVGALVFVDSSLYGKFIAGRVATQLAQEKLIVEFQDPDLIIPGISAKELEAHKVGIPFPVVLSNFSLRIGLLSALTGAPEFSVLSDAYGGEISVDAKVKPATQEVSGSGSVQGVHLEKHPQLEALGIDRAIVSISNLNFESTAQGLTGLSTALEVRDFSKPKMTSLPPFLTGGKPVLPIPPLIFTTLKTNIDFSREGRIVQLQNIKLIAPQGSLEGSLELKDTGNGSFSRSRKVAVDGKFFVRLTQQGAKELIPLLSLFTGRNIHSNTRNLQLAARGSLASPKWLVTETKN